MPFAPYVCLRHFHCLYIGPRGWYKLGPWKRETIKRLKYMVHGAILHNWTVIGPTVSEGTVIYRVLVTVND